MLLPASYIFLHAFLANFVYFAVSVTLVVMLLSLGLSTTSIAIVLAVFIGSYRAGRIIFAPLMDTIPVHIGLSLGCILAALGFFVGSFVDSVLFITLAILVLGMGMSVNVQATKQLISIRSNHTLYRQKVFALYNAVTHVAAIPTPFIAFLVLEAYGKSMLYLFLALIFLIIAMLAVFISPHRTQTLPIPFLALGKQYGLLLKQMPICRMLFINALGWFFRGLLLALIPFYFFDCLHQITLIKWAQFFKSTVMALLQMPIVFWIRKNVRTQNRDVISMAYFGFALSFLFLCLEDGYLGMIAFLVLYSAAEMLFLPSMEAQMVLLAQQNHRRAFYGLVSLSTGLGEWSGCMIFLKTYALFKASEKMLFIWPALSVLGSILAIGSALIWRYHTQHGPART